MPSTGRISSADAAYALEEQDLVDRMRRGEPRAFDQFFDAYAERVGAFAARRVRLDAAALEDVVQITMIKAINGLGRFRGDSSLFTWLCQICRNHLADVRRKAERQPSTRSLEQLQAARPSETLVELTDNSDPLDECISDAGDKAVRCVVNRLPGNYARILELRYGDDHTVPEIARILQISESAAESRLVRARQAFRDAWSGATATASA